MSLFNMLGPFTSPLTGPGTHEYGAGNHTPHTDAREPVLRSRTLSPSIFNLINPDPPHAIVQGRGALPLGATPPRPIRPRPRMRPPPQDMSMRPASDLPGMRPLASPFHQPAHWFQLPPTPSRASPLGHLAMHHSSPGSPSPFRHHPEPNVFAPLPRGTPATATPTSAPPVVPVTQPEPVPILPQSTTPATSSAPKPSVTVPGSPTSTIILTDTESAPTTPNPSSDFAKLGSKRPLRRMQALGEPEFAKLMGGGLGSRSGRPYVYEEDLALVTFIADPQHLDRRRQAELKTVKGSGSTVIPKVFQEASNIVFKGTRDPQALMIRYSTVLKAKFRVIEKLENATGGNGDADFATDEPEQDIIKKLGRRLEGAGQRNKSIHMTGADYLAWIKDPENGLYAKLADLLSKNVSVVRKAQFRSGVISPDLTHSAATNSKNLPNDIIDLDLDEPTRPSDSTAGGSQKSKGKATEGGKITASAGLAFLEDARAYHSSRAETERERLALEHRRFEIELANEKRLEQRLKLDEERVAIARSELTHVETIAKQAHELECERLVLAREREFDRKRKTDIDELDRERTHKRLRHEAATNTALQITGDKDKRFTQELQDASQAHIMLMFAQVQGLED